MCSDIHTKRINTLCGQNVELMLNLVLHKVTTRSERTKKQNMLIYHDPDKFIFHHLVLLFQVSILKGMYQLKILCVLSWVFRVHRDSQKCGVLNIYYRHPQRNYFFTC